MDEIEERRRRADAAWQQFVRDAHHVGDAVGLEIEKAKRLGIEKVRSLTVKALFESHPLAVAGGVAGLAFIMGWRGGRRSATLRAIKAAGSQAIASLPPPREHEHEGPSFVRRVAEVAALALLQRTAQHLAARAIESLQEPRVEPTPQLALPGR